MYGRGSKRVQKYESSMSRVAKGGLIAKGYTTESGR